VVQAGTLYSNPWRGGAGWWRLAPPRQWSYVPPPRFGLSAPLRAGAYFEPEREIARRLSLDPRALVAAAKLDERWSQLRLAHGEVFGGKLQKFDLSVPKQNAKQFVQASE
jgi:hypothetical protein